MSAPADLENVMQKYMTKLELESRLASTPFYIGRSVKGNWSNVKLLLEERENIRSSIAHLESGHKEKFSGNEAENNILKIAVETLRSSLQRHQVIDDLCRKWSDLLSNVCEIELSYYCSKDYEKEEYKEYILRKIASHIIQSRNRYREYESDQNTKLEEFLDDVSTLQGRVSLLMMRWVDLNIAFNKVSQYWRRKSENQHRKASELLIQGIQYQLHDKQYRIKQLEAENESKRHGLMDHEMRITKLENAAKINDQKLIDLEQNLAAKEEQIVRISAVLVPIAKDLENYVRELKSQGNRKNKQSKKKVKSALRAIKGKHEIEEKNRKLTKQVV